MKYTLLEMTQEILSSMDSDEVTSINDTTEALQVARCVRQAYYDLVEDVDLPEHYSMLELTETSGSSPTKMTLPSDVNFLKWVKYNKIASGETAPNHETVTFMPMDQFLDRMYSMNVDDTDVASYVISVGGEDMTILYKNNLAPTYYTVFGDDNTIIFDSYDAGIDTFLRASKTTCYGRLAVTFSLVDATIPDLDEEFFSRLLNEAKVLAFAELKSVDHAVANRNARRSRNRSPSRKFRVEHESDFSRLPNFGRK